jgi:hypothetical protein
MAVPALPLVDAPPTLTSGGTVDTLMVVVADPVDLFWSVAARVTT